jgi:hypothetical protein
MAALYFETDDEQQLDNAIFDGYPDRLLEDVKFIVRIVGGRLKASIHSNDAQYFSTLNAKLWLERVENYIQDYDVFIHPQTGEDVYLVTDEPAEPVVGVVGKAYTWEEVLQKAKLKEQALRILVENGTTLDGRIELEPEDIPIIRRALEAQP